MDQTTMIMLEYDKMKEMLRDYAVSYEGRRHIDELEPLTTVNAVRRALDETAEAKALLDKGASVPLPSLEGIDRIVSLLHTGYLFDEQDFTAVQTFLHSCGQLRKYMAGKRDIAPVISSYAASMQELAKLKSEIERCIRFGRVDDQASKNLERVRKKIAIVKERIQKKIAAILSRHGSILQENLVSVRGGRYVIPVKREYHKTIKGSVLDQSTSGQTVFVEPEEVAHLQSELGMLEADEAREEGIVLSALTGLLEAASADLLLNIDITGTYDFIFAKAKYSRTLGGNHVLLSDSGRIQVSGARHPFMLKTMVPLQLELGGGYRSLIITGPNTGGKTVALKTLGLLTLMVQSGLLVPVEEDSTFTVFTKVLSAIGDGQSIEQSLSTFSAQIKRLIGMVDAADRHTLLLIDELAAGTDPGEGMSLSIAILEELSRRGAMIMVTTHFNELKTFAARTPGFQNARMEFDVETLEPLYRLTIGEAGQSYAIQIATKLGMTAGIIERSQEILQRQKPLPALQPDAAEEHPVVHAASEPIEETNPSFDPAEARPGDGEKDRDQADEEQEQVPAESARKLQIGDAVYVSSYGRTGIVYEPEDAMGMVGVMIQKEKIRINQKRLKLFIEKSELYPEDYDFDIIFESKENRKKSKLMQRKHVEGLSIIRDPDSKT
ncbi:dsDNA-specific endonuclease/ATPase MutS2 [Paenibacillus rhizosphaerae]|uniref:DsDNA-specific endonuclease/ATPase MutS2 n=1 Tax=Paenibacillus rhizosphaerae TaxID=297318 RepID=A0A839TU84_9BACL|nr:DNA mismatch repair protein MutS [Paenibacillus rhizosphaerae]MBB3130386.1 dsDNA-specific endonuclease/ATPase MutS2 [Paenibacillus rhizosphaerae]